MKFHLGHLLGLSAIVVAGCAAFFSVYGLGQLFAGASLAVIIMASALEFSKLVAATFLHRYWSKVSKILRIYLTVGVVVLVTITSAGIYGFLSNAYQKTAFSLSVYEGEVGLVDSKIALFERSIENNAKTIDSKNSRVTQLSDLRTRQEVRLDSMINRRYFSNANDTRAEIKNANIEIQTLTNEIDGLVLVNNTINDSIGKYEITKLEMQTNSEVAAEVGPLKYLAELTGQPMDVIVNYFILLLIFVFDPLAISLVIATSWVFINREELLVEKDKPKKKIPEPVLEDEVLDDEKLRELRERYLEKEWDGDVPKDTKKYEEPATIIEDEEVVEDEVLDDIISTIENMVEHLDKSITEVEVPEENNESEGEIIDCEFEGDDDTEGEINDFMEVISEDVKEKLEEKPEVVIEEKVVKKPFTPEEIEIIKKNKTSSTKPSNNNIERIGSNKYLDGNNKVLFRK